jgi:3-oxoacyl-[acyl-carrier-protein] synthase-1
MAADIVIVEMGMITALGQTAPQTAASVRAGLNGFEEIAWLDKAFQPFVGAFLPEDALPPLEKAVDEMPSLTYRERRMIALATLPLKEATAEIGDKTGPPALVLGAPEQDQTFRLSDKDLLTHISAQSGVQIDTATSTVIFKGRAAGLLALNEASSRLQSGKCEHVLVGGVDSFKDLYTLGTLDMQSRVKSDQNRDGFIPGEGAGFLRLTTRKTAEAKGWPIRATVTAVSTGFEKGHLESEEPYTGDGLAETFEALFASAGKLPSPVPTVYAGFNGENHWAKEWGVSVIRHKGTLADEFEIEHPADCIGDTGAACGPLLVGMAAIGIEKAYRQAPVLVFASSDHGDRAAALVS